MFPYRTYRYHRPSLPYHVHQSDVTQYGSVDVFLTPLKAHGNRHADQRDIQIEPLSDQVYTVHSSNSYLNSNVEFLRYRYDTLHFPQWYFQRTSSGLFL